MTPDKSYKRLLIFVIMAMVVGIVALAIWLVLQSGLTARITIEVVPTGSVVVLDNKGVRGGTIKVRPGSYVITVSRNGFESQSQTITVAKGQNEYVGFALVPNSPETADWYETHKNDALKAEGISGKNFDASGKKLEDKYPFVKALPFIDQEFRIDYGRSEKEPDNPEIIAIIITHYTEGGKQLALEWLKSSGYDPASLEIIYRAKLFTF